MSFQKIFRESTKVLKEAGRAYLAGGLAGSALALALAAVVVAEVERLSFKSTPVPAWV